MAGAEPGVLIRAKLPSQFHPQALGGVGRGLATVEVEHLDHGRLQAHKPESWLLDGASR